MSETHPFGFFIPKNTKYLFLGSFPGKREYGYEWFFANKRNQFWSILENVYETELRTKEEQQEVFTKLRMAISDIILECDRKANNNSDTNLKGLKINSEAITNVIINYKIEAVYFSSRFAEKLFRRYFKELISKFPKIKLVTLPSPSPRYAIINKSEKINIYKKLLPKLPKSKPQTF
ncbi:MAG: hypothetical protein US62_C0037G0005 [Candidatus Woesebacteria bacterium GW2011_GWA1_37_8]|uniref:Uracil-DNA glycosylase-like domain-containing protein n=2 Tax=Candidatus Woeseibacteriota TaxID=1752722 RepID=A0A0G0L6H1_9BACT|nr:MAG: hypothetical protein US39_C0014G0038 [Microgenomates group bacterium GW2011_GWC1_37_12b]KKQ43968.1 MAG: hypothetical protein US62_C0037G0005 [Candidatus Woesebacteria bacterium GW2011_GWA1_37_8]KKQ86592.1 MAG: hypothetical protein UT10_C0021G0009 [Candidatus Woesebacteria bacterium GW2011_GWB1_38_8b]